MKKSAFEKGETYQACFICGSGVNLIILNAFPNDLRMVFSKKSPSIKTKKFYAQWESNWVREQEVWHLQWTKESIRDYYLKHLILHEIGHLIDSQFSRFHSNTNDKQKEDFANNYAILWNNKLKEKINLE